MNQKFNPTASYPRHQKSHLEGGIHLKEQAAKVKEVGLSILKTMGVKIKEEGMFDLLKISRPAIISYPKTYLECVAGDFYYHHFMNKAANAKTALDRLKWVVCFFISGIHKNSADMQNSGPLNPVIGETYIAEKRDGTSLYCEQISHHPPVSAYLMIGPNESYRLYGTGELEVKMNGFNNIIGRRIGKTTIEFPGGDKIVFTNPDTRIDGLLVGDRRYNYVKSCVFLDKRNKLSAEVNFLYEETGAVSKITAGFKKLFGGSSKEYKNPSDMFDVVFFDYDKQQGGEANKKVLCEGSGSWVSYIQVNNQVLWTVDEHVNDEWIEAMSQKLPSDSVFREDSKYIKMKDFDRAQKEKDNLENRQRNDAKLKKEYVEKSSKGQTQVNLEVQ